MPLRLITTLFLTAALAATATTATASARPAAGPLVVHRGQAFKVSVRTPSKGDCLAEARYADAAEGAAAAAGVGVCLSVAGDMEGFENYDEVLAAEEPTDLADPERTELDELRRHVADLQAQTAQLRERADTATKTAQDLRAALTRLANATPRRRRRVTADLRASGLLP